MECLPKYICTRAMSNIYLWKYLELTSQTLLISCFAECYRCVWHSPPCRSPSCFWIKLLCRKECWSSEARTAQDFWGDDATMFQTVCQCWIVEKYASVYDRYVNIYLHEYIRYMLLLSFILHDHLRLKILCWKIQVASLAICLTLLINKHLIFFNIFHMLP